MFLLEQELFGTEVVRIYPLLVMLGTTSVLLGMLLTIIFMHFNIELNESSLSNFLALEIGVLTTLISIISVFAVFIRERLDDIHSIYVKSIQMMSHKYGVSVYPDDVESYEFDTIVLENLKKRGLKNFEWFWRFMMLRTNALFKSLTKYLLRRMLIIGAIIILPSIVLFPFASIIHNITTLELAIVFFLVMCSIWEISVTLNYVITSYRILDKKRFYAPIKGKLKVGTIWSEEPPI